MMHILGIEWLKIRKYRAFLLLALMSAAAVPALNGIVYNVTRVVRNAASGDAAGRAIGDAIIGSPFAFPNVFQTVAYIGGFVNILPGMLMILLICNEFNFRTHRQNVIDGLSRREFMSGKILLAVLTAAGMTVMVLLTSLLLGVTVGGGFSLDGIGYVGYFFVQSLASISVAMVIAMLFRRAGIAIGLYFVYYFIAENVLSLVDAGVNLKNFLPLGSASRLIPMPTMLGKMLTTEMPAAGVLLAVAVAWIVLGMWFCSHRFEHADL